MSNAEAERLALLIGELAEAGHAAAKVLRHGYGKNRSNPFALTNRLALTQELGHVKAAIGLMCEFGDITPTTLGAYTEQKRKEVGEWLYHQGDE